MIGDWILCICLFLHFGYLDAKAKSQFREGRLSKLVVLTQFSVRFYLALLLVFGLLLVYRGVFDIPTNDILNTKFFYVVSFGMVFTHLWSIYSLWRKFDNRTAESKSR